MLALHLCHLVIVLVVQALQLAGHDCISVGRRLLEKLIHRRQLLLCCTLGLSQANVGLGALAGHLRLELVGAHFCRRTLLLELGEHAGLLRLHLLLGRCQLRIQRCGFRSGQVERLLVLRRLILSHKRRCRTLELRLLEMLPVARAHSVECGFKSHGAHLHLSQSRVVLRIHRRQLLLMLCVHLLHVSVQLVGRLHQLLRTLLCRKALLLGLLQLRLEHLRLCLCSVAMVLVLVRLLESLLSRCMLHRQLLRRLGALQRQSLLGRLALLLERRPKIRLHFLGLLALLLESRLKFRLRQGALLAQGVDGQLLTRPVLTLQLGNLCLAFGHHV